ncbi:unnamed protein product [Leptosia nina]|uniref:Doublecortin domain-containing protein n=1 Tax=Leptosia nina TaxID=320188 RepID=A0AAV1JK61_9NEOP
MVEARIPDGLRDWNALDIFIFSNGQQHSPPRKYHLCSDDLKFWESTINFLAHSQYGSTHSKIELFTIEGQRVGGPLELHNDGTYVAVTPPDPFLQSGYNKYLVKATRSWERRQEKINSAKSTPQENIHVSGNFEIIAATNNSMQKDNSGAAVTRDRITRKPNSAAKSKLTSSPRLTGISTKSKDPVEKRKLLSTKTILRKVNNTGKLSDTSSKRDSSLLKNISVINKSVIKQSLTPKQTPIIDAILETESSESAKKQTPDENVGPSTKTQENIIADTKRNSYSSDFIVEKNEKVVQSNNNVYKNSESETASIFVDVDKEMATKNNSIKYIEVSDSLSNTVVREHCSALDGKLKRKESQLSIRDASTQKSYVSLNEKPQQTQTNDCSFNLNLSIEVKNFKLNAITENEISSKSLSLKSTEGSLVKIQANVDKEGFRNEEMSVKTLDTSKSVNGNTCCHNCSRNIVVVRCSCSSHQFDFGKTFLTCPGRPQDYFILVPAKDIIYSESNDQRSNGNSKISDNTSDLKSHPKEKEEKWRDGREGCQLDNPINETSAIQAEDSMNCSKTDIKEHKVSISIDNPTVIESFKSTTENLSCAMKYIKNAVTTENTEILILPNSSQYTQTDWCDVIVEEARRDPNGQYTVQLPSLGKLKAFHLL